jgi:uncharacterized membrane protein YphA (DoxX/SURF4 family)
MRPNPLADTLSFLTAWAWPTAVFWALLLISLAIAVLVLRRDPSQRTTSHIGRFALRLIVGTMWWEQTLWKIPPNYDGLKYWMQQMVDHAWIPVQTSLVAHLVLPHISVFGPLVYAVEVLIAASLIIGTGTRAGSVLGALMAVNLWLGLYSAPNEWPWTYGFLIVIQLGYIIDPPGRSLGLDALQVAHPARATGAQAGRLT